MFWNTASAVPAYHCCSETRWLAGRMSKLSLRSGRRKFQPRCRWRMRLCGLVLRGDRDAPDAGVDGVRQREVDDAGLAAEEDRGLGALVGQLHQAAAAPAGQHIGHRVAGERRGSSWLSWPSFSLPVSPPARNRASPAAATSPRRSFAPPCIPGKDRAEIPLSAAAVVAGVGVDDLAPAARQRHVRL